MTATLSTAPSEEPRRSRPSWAIAWRSSWTGSEPDSVALGDLRIEQLEAGMPARFELLAETPGTYPLVLVDEDRRIGSLEIR